METAKNESLLQAALEYARRGVPVFPVHYITEDGVCSCGGPEANPKCKPGKHPITPSGHKSATTDPDIVRAWWTKDPEANIGMPTGRKTGVLVLDGDGERGIRTLEESGYPEDAPRVRTGSGGLHVYVKYPDDADAEIIRNGVSVAPGLDVRAESGFVILPPSRNASGPYRWEVQREGSLPDAPAWFVALLEGGGAENGTKERFDTARALAGVPEGERDHTLWKLACKFRRADLPQDVADRLVREAAANCDPPFEEDKALEKVRRAYAKYEPGVTDANTANTTGGDAVRIGTLPPPVPFPVDALPEIPRCLVLEGAASTGTTVDMFAAMVLTALGGAVGTSRQLVLKRNWREYPAIWSCVVASSGDKKSPALRIAMKPAYEEQKGLVGEYREALTRYKEELALWEERKKAAKKGERTPPRPQEPELRHVYVNDVTIEELAVILSKTPRGLLAVWDELSGFFTSMDQYKAGGRGNERAKYLSMWQGGPPLKVDRRSEDTVYADRPLVSVTGTIQPGILPELNRRHSSIARTPNADDGMAHRFLFSYPKRPVILRDLTDYDVSPVTDTWYGFLYQELRNLEPDEDGDPIEVRFSEDGERAFDRRNEEFNRLRYRPGVTEAFASTIAKIGSSQLARVSLLFCLIRSAIGDGPEEVVEEDVERATRVIEYFLAHARRVHAVLFPEKTDQRILRVLGDLLKEHGDYWKVAPEELRGALRERGAFDVPERPDELTKKLLKLSEAEEYLVVKRAWFHDKRALEIRVLPPPAPDTPGDGVGGVGTGNAPEDGVLLRKGSDLVMFVLRQRGAAFPDEIAEATGLTYGTIKKVVSQLRVEGVVEDTGELRGQSRQVRLAQQPAVTLLEDEGSGRDG